MAMARGSASYLDSAIPVEFLVPSSYQDVVFPLIFLKPLAIPSWFTSLRLQGSLLANLVLTSSGHK